MKDLASGRIQGWRKHVGSVLWPLATVGKIIKTGLLIFIKSQHYSTFIPHHSIMYLYSELMRQNSLINPFLFNSPHVSVFNSFIRALIQY